MINIGWDQFYAFLAAMAVLGTAGLWILKHLLLDDLKKTFQTKTDCNNKHALTDLILKEIRDKVSDIGDSLIKTQDTLVQLLTKARR